jgi:hypothetical protein
MPVRPPVEHASVTSCLSWRYRVVQAALEVKFDSWRFVSTAIQSQRRDSLSDARLGQLLLPASGSPGEAKEPWDVGWWKTLWYLRVPNALPYLFAGLCCEVTSRRGGHCRGSARSPPRSRDPAINELARYCSNRWIS